MTNGILRFNTNSPVEVALRWDDGKRVEGRYGEQVMYSLEGDRVMYVPPVVAQQIRELGIRAREIFEICKAELREENKRWIEWRVRRIEEPRHPASSGNVSEAAAASSSNDAQNQRNGTTHQKPRPLDLHASPDGTLLPVPVTGAGITAMELAMSGAAEVAQRVESRARMRNYSLQFTSEDIRAIRVQMTFPALQDFPLLAPLPENSSTEVIVAPEVALTKLPATNGAVAAKPEIAAVLSPSQVRCFFDCQARWWFKYGLQLPERKNSSLALGLAVHHALEVNFREKLETREDLETTGVVIVFREAWMEQVPQTVFTPDESQGDLRRLGEKLVAKYMDEVAPTVEPAAVELDVQGEIAGVSVRGRVDVLDVEGRLIDFKTASRRPSCVSPDYAFQLATYRQITPGASGAVRIDSMVKTQTVQIVQQAYTVEQPDLRATQVLYPMAQRAMGSGMYCPNRQSMLCSQKHCSFWKHCEEEFGGRVRSA